MYIWKVLEERRVLRRAGLELGMCCATTCVSSGGAFFTLPLVGNALAWRAGEPRKVLELQALFGWLIGKRGLKLSSPRLQVKDFHLAVLVQQRLFYLCVSKPLKILLGHISGELIETLK